MTQVHGGLDAALKSRYQIERELGRGGTAIVYLARDLKHGRPVALKVLRTELVHSLGAERFLREIEIAARLLHPNILPLHDSGEAEGHLYFVMPYVEGPTLRQHLDRAVQLPIDEALSITRQVAAALDYAHELGVVHRDIKPENILLLKSHVLVVDFGLARALSTASSGPVTDRRIVVGTPSYMSPEQCSPGSIIDARSDIYSLACVAFEMIAGSPPFRGTSADVTLSHHLITPPPSLCAERSDCPPGVDAMVTRALAKAPADRFRTAGEFGAALDDGASQASPGASKPARRDAKVDERKRDVSRAIAVLPFVNVGGDPEHEYFSDGITDELIGMLTRVGGLRVVSRTSAFAFKGRGEDIREIGKRLTVGLVLSGSVRRSGEALRITVELIDVVDGFNVWSATFERAMQDVFLLQEELAKAIVSELQPRLTFHGSNVLRRPTANVQAYNMYLRGRYFWNQRTPEALERALQCFTEAIAMDPDFAGAHSGVADTYVALSQFQYRPERDVLPQAETAAVRAVALDDTLAEAHNALAHVNEVYRWKWREADVGYRRALELDPLYATAWAWYGDFLTEVGRPEEGLEKMERARALEPLSVPIAFQHASLLYRTRRYAAAAIGFESIIEMFPRYYPAYVFLGATYALSGKFRNAEQLLKQALSVVGPRPLFQVVLSFTFATAARDREARAIADELVARSKREYIPAAMPALAFAGLGDRDAAFRWLDKAYEDRSLLMALLRIEPMLDNVRDDPRMGALIARVFG